MSNEKSAAPRRGHHGPGGRGAPGEKPRDFKAASKRFIDMCRPYWAIMITAFILAAVGAVCTIVGPSRIQEIVRVINAGITNGIDMDEIKSIAIGLILIYGIGAVCSYLQAFIMGTVAGRLSQQMRTRISEKINRLPLKYFDRVSYGDVLSRVTNDVDTLGQTLNMSLGQLINAVTLFIGSLIMMLKTNALLALTAILSTIFGFALMMLIVGRSQKFFTIQQRELGRIDGHIEEIYSGLNIVRSFNAEEASQKEFDEINGKLFDSAWKSQFISGIMTPMMNFIGNFGYVAVCVVGAVLTMNGTIDFSVIVAFMIYVRLFSQPLSQFAQSMTTLQSTAAASERVFDFLDEEELSPEAEGAEKTHVSKGDVEFRDVCFSYTPDKQIIKNFTAHAKSGQRIAIVGPTGSGKTTMVNLLMRFYELDSGEILLDGVPSTEMTRECIHDQVGMVLQDSWIFEDTIKNNIAFSRQGVTEADIVRACKIVGLDHYIRTLPKGYDTVLNDITSLSAGQRQLLTIARAIIEDAPLLVLDEATSSVDTRTEAQIQRALEKLTEGRTSFIIAHRLSTIKSSDVILVMREGEIVERGTHRELLEKGGFYAELYNSQFEDKSA